MFPFLRSIYKRFLTGDSPVENRYECIKSKLGSLPGNIFYLITEYGTESKRQLQLISKLNKLSEELVDFILNYDQDRGAYVENKLPQLPDTVLESTLNYARESQRNITVYQSINTDFVETVMQYDQ